MNVAFYKQFTECSGNTLDNESAVLFMYVNYINHYQLLPVIESFLQYKPPNKDANRVLVAVLIKSICRTEFKKFRSCGSSFDDDFYRMVESIPCCRYPPGWASARAATRRGR